MTARSRVFRADASGAASFVGALVGALISAVVGSLLLASPLQAQPPREVLPPERRELVQRELLETRVARVKTRQATLRLRDVRLAGDSLLGIRHELGDASADGRARFAVHLDDVLRLERRNLRRAVGWGVALGGLVGFVHARSLETKDKLKPATTQSPAFYARQQLVFASVGAFVGGGIGFAVPAWDLLHAREY